MVILESTDSVRLIQQGLLLIVLLKNANGTWVQVYTTNEMSNDYAYTNARQVYFKLTQKGTES